MPSTSSTHRRCARNRVQAIKGARIPATASASVSFSPNSGAVVRRIEVGARSVPLAAGSGYARFVGRMGALAVALGVGAAVATRAGRT